MDCASLLGTSWDLPPSFSKPSPHAHPTTPGCPWTSFPSSGPGCCLRPYEKVSAHPVPPSLRVDVTTLFWLLPSGFTLVWTCEFASGPQGQNTWVRYTLLSTCSDQAVASLALVHATCLSVSLTVGLSPSGLAVFGGAPHCGHRHEVSAEASGRANRARTEAGPTSCWPSEAKPNEGTMNEAHRELEDGTARSMTRTAMSARAKDAAAVWSPRFSY